MNATITIYYPISFESQEVLAEAKKYGLVLATPVNVDTREIHTDLPRSDVEKLEAFFVANEVPYDLIEYSKGINAPRMKKVRPEQEYLKEIDCVLYQNAEEDIEDGVVAVSTLLSIINKSKKDPLAKELLEEIKKATFSLDNVENIFEM